MVLVRAQGIFPAGSDRSTSWMREGISSCRDGQLVGVGWRAPRGGCPKASCGCNKQLGGEVVNESFPELPSYTVVFCRVLFSYSLAISSAGEMAPTPAPATAALRASLCIRSLIGVSTPCSRPDQATQPAGRHSYRQASRMKTSLTRADDFARLFCRKAHQEARSLRSRSRTRYPPFLERATATWNSLPVDFSRRQTARQQLLVHEASLGAQREDYGRCRHVGGKAYSPPCSTLPLPQPGHRSGTYERRRRYHPP